MFLADGHDREAIATARQDHVIKPGMCLDLGKCDRFFELANELDIDEYPARLLCAALGIEVPGIWIELRRVGVGLTGHARNTCDCRLFAVRMIEEDYVTDSHVVSHHVAGLVIADAVPHFAAIALQVIDAVNIGF